MIQVEVQYGVDDQGIPNEQQFQAWAACIEASKDLEVSIRIVDEQEMAELNFQYRKKSGPTNVLSFPADLPADVDVPFLGDVIICAPIVAQEATRQEKSLVSHWAHMSVHGILHLQGYDHINEADAAKMESLETSILNNLGFENPYD